MQLSQIHPEIGANETTKFPASADTWMGNQNDPLGEFVLKRKIDLEVLTSIAVEPVGVNPDQCFLLAFTDLPESVVRRVPGVGAQSEGG